MQGQHRHRGGMLHEHERSSTSPAASPCIAWVCPCPAALPPQGMFPCHPPATIHLPQSCLGAVSSLVSQTQTMRVSEVLGAQRCPIRVLLVAGSQSSGAHSPAVPSPAREELSSVAAALLDDHVLVVADDDFALLVVEHGEGAHPDGRAGRARHLVGLVELQQALRGHGKGTASAPCPVPPGWAAGARGSGGSGGTGTLLPVCKHGWWA